MAFSLKNIQTGLYQTFGIRKILELLGDAINDQLRIKDQVFKISSCIESTGTGGVGSIQWVRTSIQVTTEGQTTFNFPNEIADPEGLFLVVNGTLCEYGTSADYHITRTQLIWNGDFTLDPEDKIYIKYIQII